MRTISKYISFALMAFAVVACHTNEIDNPDNPDNPNPPQISDNVTFTASIKQTRVEYTPNGDKLDQYWKVGDVIYGFYGEGSGRKIILQVTAVDSNGNATLEPQYGTGPAFVAALKESVKNKGQQLTIGLIYTGETNITDSSYGNEIYVNFSSQGTGQIPACMRCDDYDASNTDEDGNTIVEFEFENNCAILEIKGITGAKEGANLPEGNTIGLKSVTVSSVYTSLTYTYAGGELSDPVASTSTGSIIVSPVTGSFFVDSNGNVVDSGGNSKSVMIAVVPNSVEKEIEVSAETSGGKTFGSSYNTDIAAGTCYVIRQKDVVAKTEDGLYFKTVTGAFDHASTIKNSYKTAETNIVTLVRNCGLAGIKDGTSNVGGSSPLVINGYDVTLDLNGHVLSLAGKKDFFVVNGVYDNDEEDYVQEPQTIKNTFIITDSKGKKADDEYDGKIYYLSDDEEEDNCDLDGTYMINNLGNLQIDGGTIWHNDDWSVVSNYASGELTINGGTLHSESYVTIYNDGTVTINNGTISVGDECEYDVISNNNILTVNDGTISSESSVAIHNYSGGELTINGGIISSAAPKYINNDGDLVDKMGTVTNTGGTLTILGGTIKTTSGQVEHSALWTNAQADISGGTISSINGYAIYAEGGPVNISQGDGDPCVISTETEIALILYSSAVGTISGGTITSSGKCAVSMNQKSSLTVSGGIISCTGPATGSDEISASAIQCRANNVGDSPILTVTWPEGDYTAIPDEPLLYSKSDTPIAEMSAKISGYPDFYSTVTIKGGCLYTGVNGGAFFRQDEGTYTPLQDGDGSYFYTNLPSMSNVNYAGISLNSEAQTKSIPATFHKIPNADDPLSFGKNYIKIVRYD